MKTQSLFAPAFALLALGISISPIPASAEDIIGTEKKIYSQLNEELIIRDFFQDRRDGFFVDIGCADPEHGSTTAYLERNLGWSGLAVDARNELKPLWKKQRPKSNFVAYLVSDHSDSVDPFYVVKGAEGLSSTEKEREFMGRKFEGEERRVLTITLDKLLEHYKVTEIAFLSMDIEGSELQALAGFDIARYKPELICIETGPEHRDKIVEWFVAHDYERIDKYLQHDKVNMYFQPKSAAAETK